MDMGNQVSVNNFAIDVDPLVGFFKMKFACK